MKLLIVLLLVLAVVPISITANLVDVRLCDPNLDLETAKVCYKELPSLQPKIIVVDSVTKLNRINAKPFTKTPEQFTFIYEQPTSPNEGKQVSVILTKTVSSTELKFPFPYFASDLIIGFLR